MTELEKLLKNVEESTQRVKEIVEQYKTKEKMFDKLGRYLVEPKLNDYYYYYVINEGIYTIKQDIWKGDCYDQTTFITGIFKTKEQASAHIKLVNLKNKMQAECRLMAYETDFQATFENRTPKWAVAVNFEKECLQKEFVTYTNNAFLNLYFPSEVRANEFIEKYPFEKVKHLVYL